MVPMYLLCRVQELRSSAVRRIAAFDLVQPPYPFSRCCGEVWRDFSPQEDQRLGAAVVRRCGEECWLLQESVGRVTPVYEGESNTS